MASLSKPPLLVHNHLTSSSHALIGPATLSFSKTTSLLRTRLCALKTGAGRQEADGLELLRKPVVTDLDIDLSAPDPVHLQVYLDGNSEEDEGEDGKWVDWEDKILEDTVPLVGFVRMILHSGKYESGDRLSPEHQKTVLERLLPFHPEVAKKIGCDIDYVTI
ncbi:PREDICTED: protein DCL, chloroplastic-like [Fragaria vesca subsp. vesca]